MAGLCAELKRDTSTLEDFYNWGRKSSVWPLQFGLACCAIEMIATTMARYHAFMTLQRKIDEQKLTGTNRPRHLVPDAPSEFPVPQLGEHDLVPSKNVEIWQPPKPGRTE